MIKKYYQSVSDEVAILKLKEIQNAKDALCVKGNKYYVSSNGENNNGLDINNPIGIKFFEYLNLKSGDAVFFKRGDCFRLDKCIRVISGVSYGAYGKGGKPLFLGSNQNYSKPEFWKESSTQNIWQTAISSNDAGIMIFNDNYAFGELREQLEEVKAEFDYLYDKNSGVLYLYSEKNPADVYFNIEIGTLGTFFAAGENAKDIIIDNIAMRYCCSHAISFDNNADNIKITNCEIGYCGGMRWGTERLGNGVQFWMDAQNILIENCWVYEQFDAGITFQSVLSAKYKNIKFKNNLLEYNNYNIEFFINEPDENSEMQNIDFSDNIMRFAGYGWGYNRPYVHGTAHLVGWQTVVKNQNNFKIENNIFDCSSRSLVCWFWEDGKMQQGLSVKNNMFYQTPNRRDTPDKVKGGAETNAVMTYGVVVDDFATLTADKQDEFVNGVICFDNNPKDVVWISDKKITLIKNNNE